MNLKRLSFVSTVAATAIMFAGPSAANVATATFNVTITITKACTVTTSAASNINLGSVAATTTTPGPNNSGTFTVNCSHNTPFFIGLAPSNGNTAGAGTMAGQTGGNTDVVPYQLYQNAGLTTIWGNTATATAVGNGVSGTGAGMSAGKAITETVYAQAASVDFQPDTYKDTVTINVNF